MRHFACSVHGTIEANALECLVIDHPLFQRLRKIKQLGNTHTVFPGATHTRFSHSLGVMHIAGLLFDGATKHMRGTLGESSTAAHQAFLRVRQSLRLAALLHDLGHGPYSHHFENLLVEGGKPLKYANWPSTDLKIPEAWILPQRREDFLSDHLHHEHFTYGTLCILEKELQASGVKGFDAQAIVSLLDGRVAPSQSLQADLTAISEPHGSDAWKSLQACLKSFLSSEIDADRMDYLQRDALYAGVKVGLDIRHLLHSIQIIFDSHLQRFVIDVKTNAVTVIEQILIARKQMFDQVYQHRVTLQFDDLLRQALLYWMELHSKAAPSSLAEFLLLSDERIDQELGKLIGDCEVAKETEARLALKMFLTRTTPVLIEEVLVGKDTSLDLLKTQMLQKYGPEIRFHEMKLKDFFRSDRLTEDSSKDTLFVVSSRAKGVQSSGQRIPLRLFSEVLQSTAWMESSTRVLVSKDLRQSALERNLAARLKYFCT